MINFAVGPVQSDDMVREIGGEQVPYFRTPEFSKMMLETEKLMLNFSMAPEGSKVVFITGSGTASMEAAVSNLLSHKDKVLVINGGSFGQRFVDLLNLYGITYTEIKLNHGKALKKEMLEPYDGCGYTAMLVNVHETSTGVLYDMNLIGAFCRTNNIMLIADAISSFLADKLYMSELNIDVLITGSQKALACPPGVSIIILSPVAVERLSDNTPRCMYLNLKLALENMKRGQTPFTPAVGILRQINARLNEIKNIGGIEKETERIEELAAYFRSGIKEFPFEVFPETMSNALTALHPLTAKATDIFNVLKDEYGIWICPNGGDLKDTVFRVGHIGDLAKNDVDTLLDAFRDMKKRGMI